jgi:sugar lactone lactonase YvrE
MPWGITVDELGDVYVADWRNDRIQKFNGDGKFVFKLGTSGNGEGQFNRPAGVEVDSDGDIYVADRGNDRVLQFDANGRYVDQFIGDATLSKSAYDYIKGAKFILRVRESTPLERSKRFRGPNAVRFDDQKRMYVVDSGSHRIQVYQKEAYPLGPADISEPLTAPALLNV